jgi:hypothetical protein
MHDTSAQLQARSSICAAAAEPAIGRRDRVGTEWSATAKWDSVRLTVRPLARNPAKACGVLTSCSKWRSI